MKIIDLTYEIHSEMPVFPGGKLPKLTKVSTLDEDGFRECEIAMCSHTGTHIDAPAHMLANGRCLDDFLVDKFIGKATLIDFSKKKIDTIELKKLKEYEEQIRNSEFIILKTGWSKYWGDKFYYNKFPVLSEEAAKYLAKFNLKGIGIDTISVDKVESSNFQVHKILMKKNIIIIENLTNLDLINEKYFTLSILPLKNKEADGSPVRAIAIECM